MPPLPARILRRNSMNWQEITPIFTLSMLALFGIYDLIALMNGGVQATISYWVRTTGYKDPVFAALVGGALVGLLFHFFQ